MLSQTDIHAGKLQNQAKELLQKGRKVGVHTYMWLIIHITSILFVANTPFLEKENVTICVKEHI